MLYVTNGSVTIRVTNGAYKNFYKPRGFYTVNAPKCGEAPEREISQPHDKAGSLGNFPQQKIDSPDSEVSEPELAEIPLSQMSLSQLKAYADQLGVDHEGLTTRKEFRIEIRKALKSGR